MSGWDTGLEKPSAAPEGAPRQDGYEKRLDAWMSAGERSAEGAPREGILQPPLTDEEISRGQEIAREIASRPPWKLGDRPRRHHKPLQPGRNLVSCYDLEEVDAYIAQRESALRALTEERDRHKALAELHNDSAVEANQRSQEFMAKYDKLVADGWDELKKVAEERDWALANIARRKDAAMKVTGMYRRMEKHCAEVEAERDQALEALEDAESLLYRIHSWCEAYPLEVFPAPDLKRDAELLGDMEFTRLNTHCMRHVVEGIKKIAAKHPAPATPRKEGPNAD